MSGWYVDLNFLVINFLFFYWRPSSSILCFLSPGIDPHQSFPWSHLKYLHPCSHLNFLFLGMAPTNYKTCFKHVSTLLHCSTAALQYKTFTVNESVQIHHNSFQFNIYFIVNSIAQSTFKEYDIIIILYRRFSIRSCVDIMLGSSCAMLT